MTSENQFPYFLSKTGFFYNANQEIKENSTDKIKLAIAFYRGRNDLDNALQFAEKLCVMEGYWGFEIYFPLKLEQILRDKSNGEIVDMEAITTLAYIDYTIKEIKNSDLSEEYKDTFRQLAEGIREQLMAITTQTNNPNTVMEWVETALSGFPASTPSDVRPK